MADKSTVINSAPAWLQQCAVGLVARVRERDMILTIEAAETFPAE